MLAVNGGQLFYQTFGETGHPLLVLHGGPGLGCHYLLPQMSELGKFSFAIFYDQRGAGNSTSTNEWQTSPFATYCDDINHLREAFGFEKISLLSHSFGGVFASLYALTFPQHVNTIIYLNSVPLSTVDYLKYVKHRAHIVDENKSKLDAIRQTTDFLQGNPKTIEQYYRIYFKNYFAKTHLANTLSLTMTPEAAINNFKIYDLFYSYMQKHPFNFYEKLKKLNKKSLIIACDKDVVPIQYMEHLHDSMPLSEYQLIEDCGHFPYIDQPKILFDIIRQFLTENMN
jgi:proline iminopeptidase